MSILKRIVSVFILLAFSIVLGVSTQAQQQTNRNNTREVRDMLQRLERSSSRFRNTLNLALVQGSVDQTQPQNDVSTFESGFELAIKQFRDQFTRRLAVATDVESILHKATPINSFIHENTLNPRVKNHWASVRTDLNTLANAYGLSWQWNQLTPMKVAAKGSFRLSESEVNQLIQRIEDGGDAFRVSLTDAFSRTLYDRTRSEANMNDALRSFKKATDQVRIRFDVRQLVTDDVRRLLDQATPLDTFMRDNTLTDRVKSDWLSLRGDLSVLAGAYDVAPSWGTGPSLPTGNKVTNRLTGTFKLDSSRSDNPSRPVLGNASATSGEFIVRDGETLVAILDNDLTTKLSQQGDLFTMTVRDPSQYEGAVIEGAVGSIDQGGRLSDRHRINNSCEWSEVGWTTGGVTPPWECPYVG